MIVVTTVLIILNVSVMLASVWFNHCNNLTLKQRKLIVNIIKELPLDSNWTTFYQQYISVSYKQHFICLLLCRNPWKLYKVKNNEQA